MSAHRSVWWFPAWLALAAMPCQAGATSAPDALGPLNRFQASLGVFSNQLSLEGRVDGRASHDGSERNFADALDIGDRRSVDLAELSWRPFERHEFSLRHYRDDRSRTVTLEETLRFDGRTFPVQAEFTGRAAFRALEFGYTGWIHVDERSALGLEFGVLKLTGSLSLSGTIVIDEVGEADGEAAVTDSLHAPLIGVAGRWVAAPRLRAFAKVRAIALRYDGIDGTAFSATAGMEWFPWRSLGLVLQYTDTWVEGERNGPDFNGRMEVGFNGPQMLLRYVR